jgi:hypothetical protein
VSAQDLQGKETFSAGFRGWIVFLSCLYLVFVQAISSSEKTDEEKRLIEKTKRVVIKPETIKSSGHEPIKVLYILFQNRLFMLQEVLCCPQFSDSIIVR